FPTRRSSDLLNVFAHRECPCGPNRGSHHRHAERATHKLRGWLVATVTVNDLPVIDTDVLVVGAGPTGLMAGLVLSRRATPSVVIDSKSGPTRESRAVAVQARSMEIYDQLGIVQKVLDGGNPAGRCRSARRQVCSDSAWNRLRRGRLTSPAFRSSSRVAMKSFCPRRWMTRVRQCGGELGSSQSSSMVDQATAVSRHWQTVLTGSSAFERDGASVLMVPV